MIKLVTFGLAALAAIGLVACGGGGGSTTTSSTQAAAPPASGGGGGSSSSGGGSSSTVKLAADPSQIAYDTDSLSAKAGNVFFRPGVAGSFVVTATSADNKSGIA